MDIASDARSNRRTEGDGDATRPIHGERELKQRRHALTLSENAPAPRERMVKRRARYDPANHGGDDERPLGQPTEELDAPGPSSERRERAFPRERRIELNPSGRKDQDRLPSA